jgi:hypothetical protein
MKYGTPLAAADANARQDLGSVKLIPLEPSAECGRPTARNRTSSDNAPQLRFERLKRRLPRFLRNSAWTAP